MNIYNKLNNNEVKMYNIILLIIGFVALIKQLFLLIWGFNQYLEMYKVFFFIDISELFFIISCVSYLVGKKIFIITGFYFMVLCIPGLITKIIVQMSITSIIMFMIGLYGIYIYYKQLSLINHKPIKIIENIFSKQRKRK